MRIIAISNPKGGTGKTTLTVNAGYGLQSMGYRVMLVDLDPQAILSYSLGIRPSQVQYSISHLFSNQASLEQVIHHINNVSIIPSSLALGAMEFEFSQQKGRENMLKRSLTGITGYDFILLDCPPGLGLFTLNGLTAAGEVIIPIEPEHLCLYSLTRLKDTISAINNFLNPSLKLTGIVINRLNPRRLVHKTILAEVDRLFPGLSFTTQIRDNTALTEAPGHKMDIFSYKSDSSGATDYMDLCREIVGKQ